MATTTVDAASSQQGFALLLGQRRDRGRWLRRRQRSPGYREVSTCTLEVRAEPFSIVLRETQRPPFIEPGSPRPHERHTKEYRQRCEQRLNHEMNASNGKPSSPWTRQAFGQVHLTSPSVGSTALLLVIV